MVVRKRKKRNFTTLDNDIFKNKDLSMKAKGLLCTLLSLPDDWEYSIGGLAALSKDGKTSIRSTLNELEEMGYFTREERRVNGQFKGYDYIIYEEPVSPDTTSSEPTSEKATSVERTQLNTNTLNTNESNTKKSKETVQDVLEMIPEELRETAEAFVEHRKKLKAPMTGHALELAIKKAKKLANDDLDTTIAIMEQSIENGWKGIFELKDKKKERGWMNDVQRMDDDCSGSMFDIYE